MNLKKFFTIATLILVVGMSFSCEKSEVSEDEIYALKKTEVTNEDT